MKGEHFTIKYEPSYNYHLNPKQLKEYGLTNNGISYMTAVILLDNLAGHRTLLEVLK